MLVRSCKVRKDDGLIVGRTVFIVSAVREDFGTTSIFARPLGRGRLEDRVFFAETQDLVNVIRDRKKVI